MQEAVSPVRVKPRNISIYTLLFLPGSNNMSWRNELIKK